MNVRRFLIGLLCVTLPIGVAFAFTGELVLRAFAPQDMSGRWLVTTSRGLVLNKDGGTARHQFGARTVTYRFNHLHQRGAEALPGVPRVLVLGASYTFGWLVGEDRSPPTLLQAQVERDLGPGRIQFLNAGTGGWGVDSYLAYLEEIGDAVRPSAVLVEVNGDSFRRAQAKGLYALTDPASLSLEPRSAPVPLRGLKEIVARIPFYEWLLEHSHLVQFARGLITGSLVLQGPHFRRAGPPLFSVGVNAPPPAETRRLGQAILKRIKAWGDARGVPVYMVSFYHPSDVDGVFRWLDEAAGAERIPFLDLQAPMAVAIGSDLAGHFIEGDAHPNERTNALMAALTRPWLAPLLERDVLARARK